MTWGFILLAVNSAPYLILRHVRVLVVHIVLTYLLNNPCMVPAALKISRRVSCIREDPGLLVDCGG